MSNAFENKFWYRKGGNDVVDGVKNTAIKVRLPV